MSTEIDPIEDNWYRHVDKGQMFVVISVDNDGGVIELQYFDGDIEEIDKETWYELSIEGIEPPEDWTGPMDKLETDDLGIDVSDMRPEDWAAPMEELGDGE